MLFAISSVIRFVSVLIFHNPSLLLMRISPSMYFIERMVCLKIDSLEVYLLRLKNFSVTGLKTETPSIVEIQILPTESCKID